MIASSLPGRIGGVVFFTFMVAMAYGLFLTTRDFMFTNPSFDPVASGHHAAANVYQLFGTVSGEIQRNDEHESPKATSIMHKIAIPYAVTADLTAILGGELEAGIRSFFRSTESQMDSKARNTHT